MYKNIPCHLFLPSQTLNITCKHFLSLNSETIFHIHTKWGITLRRHWISYQYTAKQSVLVNCVCAREQ